MRPARPVRAFFTPIHVEPEISEARLMGVLRANWADFSRSRMRALADYLEQLGGRTGGRTASPEGITVYPTGHRRSNLTRLSMTEHDRAVIVETPGETFMIALSSPNPCTLSFAPTEEGLENFERIRRQRGSCAPVGMDAFSMPRGHRH